ncbi:hypothetical protein [Ligilactobacillus salivarius]|nr:hypothetical protein [Ligilactobacillus salivarius]
MAFLFYVENFSGSSIVKKVNESGSNLLPLFVYHSYLVAKW